MRTLTNLYNERPTWLDLAHKKLDGAGTAKGDELELLLLLVETYEDSAYPIDPHDPIAALRFRMEQQGLKPKDLVPYIGSKSKVSKVLSGKRRLSLAMLRKLVARLHLPAEVALGAPKAPQSRGARYTSKDDILTPLEPLVMAPLRREWEAVKGECLALRPKRQSMIARGPIPSVLTVFRGLHAQCRETGIS